MSKQAEMAVKTFGAGALEWAEIGLQEATTQHLFGLGAFETLAVVEFYKSIITELKAV
tara:strand:- start:266 stop:439 length:174 start_codon:yes stop_codon:yes gene_type:complete